MKNQVKNQKHNIMIKLGQLITLKPLQEVEEPAVDNSTQTDADAKKGDTAEIQKLEKVLAGPLKNYLARVNSPQELGKMLNFLLDNINDNLKSNSKLRPLLKDLFNKF